MKENSIELLKYLQKTKGLPRRTYTELISKKLIFVNDNVIERIDTKINIGDKILIKLEGGQEYKEIIKRMPKFKASIVLFNKPKGCVVSKDDKHNKTIFEYLPPSWKKDFYYIGRLDKDSHGLLLLTNDPKLVDYYENPKNKIYKIYKVIIDKPIKSKHIFKLTKGIPVDESGNLIDILRKEPGTEYEILKAYKISSIKNDKGQIVLEIILTEGKKRHIRRMLNALSYKVIDLQRIKFGKYQLGTIKIGKYMMGKI